MKFICAKLFPLVLIQLISCHVDPSEYFQGSQQRPKLEIVYPQNGQVHDQGTMEIKIRIGGYNFPSQFHGSHVCVGVGTSDAGITEDCFEPAKDLTFHVRGLAPGGTYTLRVVFLERQKAIAVSVRSFRVAAILGLLEDKSRGVTIHTALEMAVLKQSSGVFLEAEKIYRNILEHNPQHPYTLHLLG